MNDYAFHKCREFLEERMFKTPDNQELIRAYETLIQEKTKFDMSFFSQNAEIQKNWNNNQMELSKQYQIGQTEIIKKQLEQKQ